MKASRRDLVGRRTPGVRDLNRAPSQGARVNARQGGVESVASGLEVDLFLGFGPTTQSLYLARTKTRTNSG